MKIRIFEWFLELIGKRENKIMTDPMVYDNRELSWLKFNTRVLEEAEDDRNSLWYGADRCMIRCICRRRSRITKQE